jgi:serine/threonine protein phosphatase 1
MSKVLFVVSDIHSYYTPLKKALDEKGFDPNNENHWLIVCGDAFDRGDESEEVLHFLMQLERKILIKGNHDILLEQLCHREAPYNHDYFNGTLQTLEDLGERDNGYSFEKCCEVCWNKIAAYRDLLVNYFETKNYIFVHSWIPIDDNWTDDPNWRKATDDRWEKAMWVNPFDMSMAGLNQTGKTIIFGHWHCSAGHKMLGHCNDEFNGYPIWEPCYMGDAIGIDRCTAHTGEVNVLVLEDEFLEG